MSAGCAGCTKEGTGVVSCTMKTWSKIKKKKKNNPLCYRSKSFEKIRIENLKSLAYFLANFQRSMQCTPQGCWDHAKGRTLQKHILLSLRS